jgi:hypothetical protein
MIKNYQDTKIYKLVCNTTGLIYIGATTNKYLSQRLAAHVSIFKRYKNGQDVTYNTAFEVLENNNYNICLLETSCCSSIEEQAVLERHYIDVLSCVNKVIPGRTRKEYNETYIYVNKNTICKTCNLESDKMKGCMCCDCYNVLQKERYKSSYKKWHIDHKVKSDNPVGRPKAPMLTDV